MLSADEKIGDTIGKRGTRFLAIAIAGSRAQFAFSTRRRYAVINKKQFAAKQSSRPARSSLQGRKRRTS